MRKKAGSNISAPAIYFNTPSQLLPEAHLCPRNADHSYDKGILLVHGLLDSPYGMQQLAQFFLKKCYVVNIALLPGHGSVPGNLLTVKYQDWIDTLNFDAQQLQKVAKHLYIGGYSLGGLLTIDQVLENPTRYQAVLLFAPALKIKSDLRPLILPLYWLSRIIPRLQWWQIEADGSPVRYESLPVNAVY